MLSALVLAAATAALPADLAQAVHDYDQAQVASDKAALERLLAPDYQLANSGGQMETKAQFVAEQLAPGYKLNPFTVEEPVERVMGDVALMGGAADLSGTDHGKAFSVRLRFLDVWQKRDGRWQVVYTQATRIPKG
jgi:ketosteroid isomerase-like protein